MGIVVCVKQVPDTTEVKIESGEEHVDPRRSSQHRQPF